MIKTLYSIDSWGPGKYTCILSPPVTHQFACEPSLEFEVHYKVPIELFKELFDALMAFYHTEYLWKAIKLI